MIKDMTHKQFCAFLLPIVTDCYFKNRQKLDRGDSMELVTAQVAQDAVKLRPTAQPHEIQEAFSSGAAGDYEDNGQPPYLTPNKFRYFLKKYYESKTGQNMQQDEEPVLALPYFSSWEERQIYHITRRYADTLKGYTTMLFDSDILFRFFKKIGFASDGDVINDIMMSRARNRISALPAEDTPLMGVAKSIEMKMNDRQALERSAMAVFIEDIMKSWRARGMSADDVAVMLRGNVKDRTDDVTAQF